MTKQEARNQCLCRHCPYRDYETEECLAGDMDSNICPRNTKKKKEDKKTMSRYTVEPCVSDYAVKDNKGNDTIICNSKRNADLIAAILEKDSHCGDGWTGAGNSYTFTDDDYYKVIGQYSIRQVYEVEEVKTEDGQLCRNFAVGNIVRHFKGNLYQIKEIAKHTETGELMVVYQALYDTPVSLCPCVPESPVLNQHLTFTRPLAMFSEEVDRKKYPYAGQQYRMEIVRFKDVRQEGKL